jgi:hypothetical protein
MARFAHPASIGVVTPAALDAVAAVVAAIASPVVPAHFVGAVGFMDVSKLGATPPVISVPASGAARALVVPAFGGVCYDVTLTANCTFTITGWTPGVRQVVHLVLRQDATGGRVVTLPTVKWSNGTALTFATTASGVTDLSLTSTDGGATIIAK